MSLYPPLNHYQIPWPQNYILAGTSKSRVTYDSVSSFQWMAGFSAIIREEKNVKIKNAMLEYMTDIMEDAQDFGWATANGAHALILCRMEEGKVDWLSSEKLDRLRRAHAQKIVTNTGSNSNSSKNRTEAQGVPCKFYQSAKCSHKNDHTTSGQLYRHICSYCFSLGKILHTQSRNVEISVNRMQKTNRALQICSAHFESWIQQQSKYYCERSGYRTRVQNQNYL